MVFRIQGSKNSINNIYVQLIFKFSQFFSGFFILNAPDLKKKDQVHIFIVIFNTIGIEKKSLALLSRSMCIWYAIYLRQLIKKP